MTEKELRKKYIDVLVDWVGCKESDGSHKKIIDLYNTQKPLPVSYKVKYTDAWCATTVSAGAVAVGLVDIFPSECGCGRLIDKAKKMGIWVEDDAYIPNVGDWVLYDWEDNGVGDNKGNPDHVGAVVSVSGNTIKVVEGNKSNAVGYRNLAVNGKYIRGFVTPNFASKATKEPEKKKEDPKPVTPVKPATKTITELANEVIAGKWGSGTDRKKKLTEAGYDYEKVQAKVNEILKKPATKTYAVGDVVTYTGKVHYPNAGKNATGKTCKGGKAKITQISKGSAHPYHLVAVKGSGATVYGWVNAGTFN